MGVSPLSGVPAPGGPLRTPGSFCARHIEDIAKKSATRLLPRNHWNSGRFGTLGRNTFRGPAYYDFDFALVKTTPIGHRESGLERADLQFRAELFNLFNLVNMGLPANIIEGTGFGMISKTAGTSRQIQLSLKLIYWGASCSDTGLGGGQKHAFQEDSVFANVDELQLERTISSCKRRAPVWPLPGDTSEDRKSARRSIVRARNDRTSAW
jgi:hypothetical protein